MSWGHDELANDLAQHLVADSRMVWTDMQMGPSGSPRPDVYTLQKSYSQPRPIAYEVKVSRSDFLSDVNSGKWQKYLAFSGGVVFCVPLGLIKKTEVPQECGLMVRGENGWRTMKREKPGTGRPDFRACMKLLIDGVGRTVHARVCEPKLHNSWTVQKAVKRDLGEEVAKVVGDHLRAADNIKYEQERAATLRREAEECLRTARNDARSAADKAVTEALQAIESLRLTAAEALGLGPEVNWRNLRWEMRSIARELNKDSQFAAMRNEIESLREIISRAAQRANDVTVTERILENTDDN